MGSLDFSMIILVWSLYYVLVLMLVVLLFPGESFEEGCQWAARGDLQMQVIIDKELVPAAIKLSARVSPSLCFDLKRKFTSFTFSI